MDEKPKLRAVDAVPVDMNGERVVYLRDPSGLTNKTVALPTRSFFMAALCDGQHTLRDIQTEYVRRFGDLVFIEKVEELVRQLDGALFLEGERFEAHRRAAAEKFAAARVRPASHAGTAYPKQPPALKRMLDGFFTSEDGPGKIDRTKRGSDVVAIAAPHIDLRRGGPTYAHAYKQLAECCAADTFVILGVSHQEAEGLFIVTDKDFETPLGTVECDRDFTRELTARAGLQRGTDELLHRGEHSVEFQALFLRHVFGASRPVRIVPVLCGPVLPVVGDAPDPLGVEPIGNFVRALRGLLRERKGKAALIASVDLSHVGRRFGDATDVNTGVLTWLEAEDRKLLKYAEEMDATGFFEKNRRDKDRTHVCGFSAIYVMLNAIEAARGQLLHYVQAPEEQTQSVVTFAAMVFEK